jgi:hypothetical protein
VRDVVCSQAVSTNEKTTLNLRQIAMPLFADAEPVPSAAVIAAWAELFPGGSPLVARDSSSEVRAYSIEDREVVAAFMPAPIPNDEALRNVRTSWMWQGPDDAVRTHRSHAIVTAQSDAGVLACALDVTRLSAALLKAGAGAALYWGSSRQVHTTELALDLAATSSMPVPLWVGITVSGESEKNGPFSAATHGLEALGHRELEVTGTRMGIGDLRMALLDIASYVLENGPVLEHGQTIGRTADEKWPIEHGPSQLVPGRQAIRLGVP